jgi:predicted enzyme related to lactoylglutathione lyase
VTSYGLAIGDLRRRLQHVLSRGSRTGGGHLPRSGPNANLPPQWLLYVVVADLEQSVATATREGGTIIDGPRAASWGRICVVKDPTGAFVALYEPISASHESEAAPGPKERV